jgi:hypothetical protein
MTDNNFTCAACGGEFEMAWSEQEARDEYERDFGPLDPSKVVTVCDDCYLALKEQEEKERKRMQ